MKNNKNFLVIGVGICLLAIALSVMFYKKTDNIDQVKTTTENTPDTVIEEPEKTIEEKMDGAKEEIFKTENDLPDLSKLNPKDFPTSTKNNIEALAGDFNCELEQTGIVTEGIFSYDGIFIEQNTDEECSNIAIAKFINTTDKMISYAEIEFAVEEDSWIFTMSAVPAQGTILVQEKNAAIYYNKKVKLKKISVSFEENVSKLEERVNILEDERGGLNVENISGEPIPLLRIFYKIKEQDTYIGGITYTVKLENLLPGEPQIIYPSHYVPQNAEIMMVREYEE